MHAEDRTIHFSTELFHQPVKHKVAALQRLYFELSQTRVAAYDNTDFNMPHQPKFYSRRGARTHSVLVFLPDRIVVIEEWADIPVSGFTDKVLEVGEKSMEILELPGFHTQSATIRATSALSHFDDAQSFLLDRVCAQTGRIDAYFQRPLSTAGLRFVLPETPEHRGALNVIVEPFRQSPNEMFVEVKGLFKDVHLESGQMFVAAENVALIRGFITDSIYPYLNQFDIPLEARG